MSYMHIDNLYKTGTIFLFRECYALEKVNGTSAHIEFDPAEPYLEFFPGGVKIQRFVETLPPAETLQSRFYELDAGENIVTVYGEAYGGKVQRMKDTYGDRLRFIVFDVRIGESWLSVPQAAQVAYKLGLEFVPYDRIPATAEAVNGARDKESYIALRNAAGCGKMREGVVLRPLVELRTNNGRRVIAKHKNDAFAERMHPPKVRQEPTAAMRDALAIADEWVTPTRLEHVLDAFAQPHKLQMTGAVIDAMVADVEREAEGEIVMSRAARRAMAARAALLLKEYLKAREP